MGGSRDQIAAETTLVVEKGITIGGKKLKDHLEAIDHHEALRYVRDLARHGAPRPTTRRPPRTGSADQRSAGPAGLDPAIHTPAEQPLRSKVPIVRRLLWPGISALLMLAVLLGLGTWQVQRLHWKEGILAQIAHAEASPPVPLRGEPSPFTKVEVTGRLRNDLTALYGAEVRETRTGPRMGAYLIEPLERQGAPPLLVDRGWVPLDRTRPIAQPDGPVTITGYVHPADRPGWFSAADDPATRTFYTLDPTAIGSALGLPGVSPFVLVALGPQPAGEWPDPAKHLPRPPNNHLQYALTWYGLAAVLVVMFVLWSRKVPHA